MDETGVSGIASGRGNPLRLLMRSLTAGFRAWRRRQREWALLHELQGLDDHLLKDIGYRRDELLVAVRNDLGSEATDEEPAHKTSRQTACRCRLCGAPLPGCSA